jgi:hypothetical protein
VRGKIERACSGILKEQLSEAEKWIANEQSSARNNISKVEKVEEETLKSIHKAGNFDTTEIDVHTASFQRKRSIFEQAINELEALKSRVTKIGSTNTPAKQTPKHHHQEQKPIDA